MFHSFFYVYQRVNPYEIPKKIVAIEIVHLPSYKWWIFPSFFVNVDQRVYHCRNSGRNQ